MQVPLFWGNFVLLFVNFFVFFFGKTQNPICNKHSRGGSGWEAGYFSLWHNAELCKPDRVTSVPTLAVANRNFGILPKTTYPQSEALIEHKWKTILMDRWGDAHLCGWKTLHSSRKFYQIHSHWYGYGYRDRYRYWYRYGCGFGRQSQSHCRGTAKSTLVCQLNWTSGSAFEFQKWAQEQKLRYTASEYLCIWARIGVCAYLYLCVLL